MPAAEDVVQGAPCWVSLAAPDLAMVKDFYAATLGWRYRPGFGLDEYAIALSDEAPLAGMGAAGRAPGVPRAWSVHFAVSSVDQAADRVRERGGTVAVGPLSFGPGRMAWATDPDGAPFVLWEGPVTPRWGAGRPGSGSSRRVWLDLHTRDTFAAAIFYSQALGWDTEPPERCALRYEDDREVLEIHGHAVASLYGGAVDQAPDPKIRPRWQVTFRTPNAEEAAGRAVAAGGVLVGPVRSTSIGPGLRLSDVQGTLFAVADI
ncbi:VOC family protein [Streptomyces sp. H39-S7]|uniref:VOC family protein n=1 Tax=Streptomyces sp. H39-S7 TaxID=3004357 RepID=UPI0022AEE537|nr:VOC family protein [Streptomyces sp. H39-S7]MCZ4121043.1 VOC family protein [Streptomyces sp. H39-S7]